MEEMETLFGASVLANIRFPNGRRKSLYTLKVGEAIQFAETSVKEQLLTTCFKFFQQRPK